MCTPSARQNRPGLLWVGTIAVLCVCVCAAHATITVEEARIIAQAHTSTSLDSAEAFADDIGDGLVMATFRVNDGDNWVETVRVELTQGQFAGLSRPRPEGTPTLTPLQCLAYAQAEAQVQMGEIAENLTWTAEPIVPGEVLCKGQGPAVGSPPRPGLSPSCDVNVSTVDGTIVHYSHEIPEGEQPITPTVSPEQAGQIAIEAVGIEGTTVRGDPELHQQAGALLWLVNVGLPSADDAIVCLISATTGGVVQVAWPHSAPPGDAKPASQAVTAPQTPPAPTRATLPPGVTEPPESGSERAGVPMVPVIALVLLLCAAGGLVLLRRRR